MTVLTVRAQDTATAMEEIVEKLGKDSYIIGTKKIGNEILVKATNSPKKTTHSKQNLNKTFNKMISKELNQSSVSSLGNKSPNGIDDKGEKFSINNFGEKALKEFRAEFKNLKDQGFTIFAANNSAKAIDFRTADFTNASTIILGAELDGVSDEAIELSDQEIKIPMNGMVESLNVSVANAVILFEIQRQRQRANLYKKRQIDNYEYERLLFEFSYPEVAQILNKKGESYPKLDDNGQVIA